MKILIALAVSIPFFVLAEAPPKASFAIILPKVVVSKIPKEEAAAKPEGDVEKIAVSTTLPQVGQKVSVEAVIMNNYKHEISVNENYLGTERKHTLKPGEQITMSYDYIRKLKSEPIAEFKILAKASNPEQGANFTLREEKDGFNCVAQNFHGPGCKVRPFRQKSGRPSFRLSIPFVFEE